MVGHDSKRDTASSDGGTEVGDEDGRVHGNQDVEKAGARNEKGGDLSESSEELGKTSTPENADGQPSNSNP